MSRSRNIKPGFFTNDRLAECHPLARLLYAGLWCYSDRSGRGEYRPLKIKAACLPYDDGAHIPTLFEQLRARGFVVLYRCGGVLYFAIPRFPAHQNPHVREQISRVPAPASEGVEILLATPDALDEPGASTVLAQCMPGASTVQARLIPDSRFLNHDSRFTIPDPQELVLHAVGNLVEGRQQIASPDAPKSHSGASESDSEAMVAPDGAPPAENGADGAVVVLPSKGGESIPITLAEVLELCELYPTVDVETHLKRMRAWLVNNPHRRKSGRRGTRTFIAKWLAKEAERPAETGKKGGAVARQFDATDYQPDGDPAWLNGDHDDD